ncbi:FAD/NAD(P)-binding domain-containing protein [Paramyrothecium foliicola]|nr:FAD/NAD(P)-binding domain-containing protein [Paramyrothecium foliicola]
MVPVVANGISASAFADIEAKYDAERDKRLKERPQGEAQFIDLTTVDQYKHLTDDPWVEPEDHKTVPHTIDLDKPIKYLIAGAGYSGLLFAVRLLEAGANLEDLVLVDSSGGYGGVWYWNRYPGLMCDVESYIYMPLLEETGYMPKHKYCYGPELREHAERIADHWSLRERTIFRQQADKMVWDAAASEWTIKTKFAGENEEYDLDFRASYVILAGGQLTRPKIPVVENLEAFKGHVVHTSRWDYGYTGGCSSNAKPKMANLADKKVAVIGTGATAVQLIPELAKYAKHLFVVQRTPSSVDVRGQRETDPEEWRTITSNQGWWLDRNVNFAKILHQATPQPAVNMVNDGWVVGNPSYCTAWGYDNELAPEQVVEFVQRMHIGDIPRAERLRRRVEEIVQNAETAEHLKHWYPSWCKRPCFHDDYLPTFNKPNVTLLDTGGRGVEKFTDKGVVVNGIEHEIDLLVLATGYKVLGGSMTMSPAIRFGLTIEGKDGIDMNAAFEEEISTLHGLCRAGFPNMFWAGAAQASLTANQIMSMDAFAEHVAYILLEAQRKSGSSRTIIESTQAAQDDWGDQTASVALGMSAMVGCTPNYLNFEGDMDRVLAEGPEMQPRIMRSGLWGRGINHYKDVLKRWRDEDSLRGLDISAVA